MIAGIVTILSLFWRQIFGFLTVIYIKLTSMSNDDKNQTGGTSKILASGGSGSRGIRNRNPGNIKYNAANNWEGKIPYSQNTDNGKTYEQFSSMQFGIRASLKLLQNYIKMGHSTPKKIAIRWAEDAPGYAAHLANYVGITQDTAITLSDVSAIKKTAMAIFHIENNGYQFSSDELDRAWASL
jgi:hypothetical protein